MSAGATAITDQVGVNAAPSFDAAADALLNSVSPEPSEGGSPADKGPAGKDGAGIAAGEGSAGKPAEAQAGVEGQAAPAAKDGQEPAAAEAKVDEWAIDDGMLAKALADPTHGQIVKLLSEQRQRLLGYRDHWTLDEARAARELAPGGIEELKASVQAGRDARAENAEFESGDPMRQSAALKSIAADMPEAFAAGVTPYLNTLKEVNPEAYQKTVGGIATEVLRAEGLPDLIGTHLAALDALRSAAERGDEKGFQEAFAQVIGAQQVRQWAEKVGIAAQAGKANAKQISPEVASLQKELQGYKDREAQNSQKAHDQTVQEFQAWSKSMDEMWHAKVKEEAGKLLEVIPKNMPAAAREQLVTRVEREIVQEIDKRIGEEMAKGYGDLKSRIDAVVTNQAWKLNGEKTRDQVANLILARAKQLLPHVAKSILDPFSTATVAAAQARSERETQNASRVDVRGGTSGPKPKTPLTIEDMKGNGRGSRMSNEEILDL